jgi:two-component system, OmpR family, sensor histidine kinase KdpD
MDSQTTLSSNVQRFLDMIRDARRGKLKIYIGMAAGVGKTYRMLVEAHQLIANGIDLEIGFVETHGREETARLADNIPAIPRKSLFYKGKQLEEMDVDAILSRKPAVVLVDELAHSNVSGSRNEKRWQDVNELIEAGINVISTVNIQHIESINELVEKIIGVTVHELVPDGVLQAADEVVNVDLTIDELIERLKAGKIYDQQKTPIALQNFFQKEKLLQLRDLALKEVSRLVERKIVREIPITEREKLQAIITAISTNYRSGRKLIRKSSRLASLYNSKWYVVYVQTSKESTAKIDATDQRQLINNFQRAAELGAQVVQLQGEHVAQVIVDFAKSKEASLIVLGKPPSGILRNLRFRKVFRLTELTKLTSHENIDILLVTSDEND